MNEHDRRTLHRQLCVALDRGRGGAKRERRHEYLLFHRCLLPDKTRFRPRIIRGHVRAIERRPWNG